MHVQDQFWQDFEKQEKLFKEQVAEAKDRAAERKVGFQGCIASDFEPRPPAVGKFYCSSHLFPGLWRAGRIIELL